MNIDQVKLDRKENNYFFIDIDNFFFEKLIHYVPSNIETYHLTLLSLLWSALVIVFGYLSSTNIQWLCASSVIIVAHYITDMLDGKVGKLRDTGLVKWGYYMDHFFDYIFMASIFIGYSFLLNAFFKFLLFGLFALLTGFMIHTFLYFSVTNKFKISWYRLGPTELRFFGVLINLLAMFLGAKIFSYVLIIFIIISTILLIMTVYKTQLLFWEIDMKAKVKNS